jgi:Putative DNA-binding domain
MRPEESFASGLLDPAAGVPVGAAQARRYGVYRNNVTVGLTKAMAANFPVVRRLLGATYFDGMVLDYVRAHPPRSPLMFRYGEGFADYLARDEDLSRYPYLADVARIEQACRIAFHAADAAPFNGAALSSYAPDDLAFLVLKPHPAFAMVTSRFAAHSIWAANGGGGEMPVDWQRPEATLVTRPELEVMTRVVTAGEAAFLVALASGATLQQAAEMALSSDSRFDLGQALAVAITAGAFAFN